MAVCGLGFLFALDGLGEAAADAVGVVVELFECIHCARLCETDGCDQGGSSEKFEQVVLFHHYFPCWKGCGAQYRCYKITMQAAYGRFTFCKQCSELIF